MVTGLLSFVFSFILGPRFSMYKIKKLMRTWANIHISIVIIRFIPVLVIIDWLYVLKGFQRVLGTPVRFLEIGHGISAFSR